MKKELFGLLVIAVIFVTGCTTVQEETLDVVEVTDFASCVEAGNPIMESYPEQCAHDGQTFVNPEQVIPVEPDGGIGDGASPLPMLCENPRPEMCTREYIPVCGDDGQTYGNKCTACSNVDVFSYKEGECETEIPQPEVHICTDAEKEAMICTMEYMPVCGSDGETYGNGCGACSAQVESWVAGECN